MERNVVIPFESLKKQGVKDSRIKQEEKNVCVKKEL
jgi:hypothetical protein